MLVYSDSLSRRIIPTTRLRQPFDARWPGVLEIALAEQGHPVRVIEVPGTSASAVDGIHLDADQRRSLGKAVARFVAALPGVLTTAAT